MGRISLYPCRNIGRKVVLHMAKNKEPGKGRVGAVKDRHQVYNPKTDQWVKVDSDTGKFMDVKQDGTPFKGVTKK